MEWQISNQPLQGALGSSSQFEVLPHPAFITWESWFRFFRLPIMPQHFDQNYWCVKVIKSKGTMCDILPNCSPFTIWGPDKAQPLPFGWEICLLCIAHLTVPEWDSCSCRLDLSCTMIGLEPTFGQLGPYLWFSLQTYPFQKMKRSQKLDIFQISNAFPANWGPQISQIFPRGMHPDPSLRLLTRPHSAPPPPPPPSTSECAL